MRSGQLFRTVFGSILIAGGLAVGGGIAAIATAAPASALSCTNSWNNTAGGSWTTPTDWSANRVPNSNDVVCITDPGTYTVTLSENATVQVDALIVGSGVTSDAETLSIQSNCSTNIELQTLNAGGAGDVDSIASTGQINLESANCNNTDELAIGSSLTNNGSLETLAGNGQGSRTITGNVTNDGTVSVASSVSYAAGTWANDGALDIATGETITTGTSAASSFTNGTGGSIVSTASGTGQLVISAGSSYTQGAGTTSGEPVFANGPQSGTDSVAVDFTGSGASSVLAQGLTTLTGNLSSGQNFTNDSACSTNSTTTLLANVNNAGTIDLENTNCNNQVTLNTSTFTLDTTSGGQMNSLAGNGQGTYTFEGNVTIGGGSSTISYNTTYSSGTWDNAGALSIADSTTLNVSSSTATFDNATGGSVSTTGDSSTGELEINSTDTYDQGAGKVTGNAVYLNGPQSSPGAIVLEYTGPGNSLVTEGGLVTLTGTIAAGQSLTIDSQCSTNSTVTLGGNVSSSGTVDLVNSNCNNNTTLAASTFTFTNASGGQLNSLAGNGQGTYAITGNVTNDGSSTISRSTTYSSGTWDNKGTVTVADSQTLDATTSATFNNDTGGKVSTTGDGTTGALEVTTGGDTYEQGNGTTVGGAVDIVGPQSGTPIAIEYTGTGGSTLLEQGVTTLTGKVVSGQSLTIDASCSNNATVTLGAKVTVGGTIDLENSACNNNATLAAPTGTKIVVSTTGVIDSLAGNGSGSYTISGQVKNSGKVTVDHALTYTPIKNFINLGTVTVAANVTVTGVAGTKFENNGGKINSTAGTLTIDGPTEYVQNDGKTKGNPVVVSAGALDYTGTGKSSVTIEGSSTVTGNISKNQTLTVDSFCSLNATAAATASFSNAGTIDLENTNCNNNAELTLPAGDTLTNAAGGVIEWLVGNGQGFREIVGNVVNNGTIGESGVASLTIDGNFSQSSAGVFDANVSASGGDSIAITGSGNTATLGGTLTAVPVSGFTPSSGYSATVITGTHSGTFSSVGPAGWSAAYGTNVTLNFT